MEKGHLSFKGRRGIREEEMEVSLMTTVAEIICWSWKAPDWVEDWEIEKIVNNFEGSVQVQYKLRGWFKNGNVARGGVRILVIWVCWLEHRLNSLPGWNCHQETSLGGTKEKVYGIGLETTIQDDLNLFITNLLVLKQCVIYLTIVLSSI